MRYLEPIGFLALAFVLASCTASPTPTSIDPPPAAEEVLSRAREAMSEVQSYRFTGELVANTDEGVQGVRLSGEWAAPDSSRMRFQGLGEGAGHDQEVITVGGRVLASDSDYKNGAWTEQRARSPGALSSGSWVPDLDDTALLKDEVIDTLAVYHLSGASMPDVAEGVLAPVNTYDLYIGKDDLLLRRLVIETDFSGLAELAPSDEDFVPTTQRVTYDFYDYNEPVTIELPVLPGG